MPTPGANEQQDEFMSRCIPMVLDEGTAESNEQAVAICHSMWEEAHKAGITKREADGEHPAGHYLVVEDPKQPSTWHLRVRNNEGQLDHRLMGAAWAALHEGYRGNRYQGPNKQEAIGKLTKLYKQEGLELPAKNDFLWVLSGASVTAYKTDGEWKLEVLGAPYGGHLGGKDAQGEYFTDRTDFMLNIGDQRPVLYFHGRKENGQPEARPIPVGIATATRRDSRGLWFEVALNKASKYAERIWNAAMQGLARASTGAINYLTRVAKTGEILVWPIGELTLLDEGQGRAPANEFATVSLKSVFDETDLDLPEAFAEAVTITVKANAGEDSEDSEQQSYDFDRNLVNKILEVQRGIKR